jgi:TP901 family phage tail tape measure protein
MNFGVMATKKEEKIVKIITDGKQAEASINQITKAVSALSRERNKMKRDDPGYGKMTEDLQALNGKLSAAKNEVKALDTASTGFWGNFKTMAAGVAGGNFLSTIANGFKEFAIEMVARQAQLSDAYADIRKVTGLTMDGVKDLDEELAGLNTRTSQDELRNLAAEAGKLGKSGIKDIKQFVMEADQLKVALGEDLGEDAITDVGRLSEIFHTSILEMGSAINEIGAQSAATEGYQVDFLNRMAGTGPTAQLAAADLLGYSATLENMGQTAEVSGTAMSKFFVDFVKDGEKFGSIAGMQKGAITEMLNSKGTNAAFLAFLENMKKSKTNTQAFMQALDEMGIDGSRSIGVFLALANSTEEVAKQQAIANQAITEGTSLTNEFNIKNETFAAKLEKGWKAIDYAMMNSGVAKMITRVVSAFADLVTEVDSAEKQFNDMIATEKNLQEQMNIDIQILKENKIGQETRKELINQINEAYKSYLPSLLTEKSTLEDITKAQLEANKAFEKGILIKTYEKDLQAAQSKVLEKQKILVNTELRKQRLDKDKSKWGSDQQREVTGTGYNEYQKQLLQLSNVTQEEVDAARKEYEEVMELYNQIAQQAYGKSIFDLIHEKVSGNPDNPAMTGDGTNLGKKELDQIKRDREEAYRMMQDYQKKISVLKATSDWQANDRSILADYEAEKEKINNLKITQAEKDELLKQAEEKRYQMMVDYDKKHADTTELVMQTAAERMMAIDVSLSKEKVELQKKELQERLKLIRDHEQKVKQLRKEKIRESSAELQNLAFNLLDTENQKKFGALVNDLDRRRDAELNNANLTEEARSKINKRYDDERREIMNRQAKADKNMAMFRIAMDTAVAAVSAYKTDPTGILSGLIVLQGAIQAAAVAAQALPQYFDGGVTGAKDGKTYYPKNLSSISGGGVIGGPSVGLFGERGPELVIPNYLYEEPRLANTMMALESMIASGRLPDAGRSAQGSSATAPGNNNELMQIVAMNTMAINSLQEQLRTGIIGKISWNRTDRDELDKYNQRIDTVKALSKL